MRDSSFLREVHMVCKYPEMFCVESLRDIVVYFMGWFRGANYPEKDMNCFQKWITEKFGEPPANHWLFVILRNLDEKNGLISFQKVVEEFYNEVPS